MPDLSTQLAGIELPGYLGNASGPICTTEDELTQLLVQTGVSYVTTKTCTIDPREGNPEPRYYENELGSLNSMGLPNLGFRAYLEMMPTLKKMGKCVNVSIGGMYENDTITILEDFLEQGLADFIELNLSCPNLVGKPQIGYDFEEVESILQKVDATNPKIPIGLKLPPYFDFAHWRAMAEIISRHKVDFITCVNSIGNALVIDPQTESVVIKPKDGFGGLGGDYLKPVALSNVRAFYQEFKRLGVKIDIIGVGGIKNGKDVFEFVLAGADLVQLGTVLMREGPQAFERINKELIELLNNKEYKTLRERKGMLQTIQLS